MAHAHRSIAGGKCRGVVPRICCPLSSPRYHLRIAVLVPRPSLAVQRGCHGVRPSAASEALDVQSTSESARFEAITAALQQRADDLGVIDKDPHAVVDPNDFDEPDEFEEPPQRNAKRARASKATEPFSLETTTPRKDRNQQLPMDALPKVAVVGRPNVGKSALFNRFAGSNLAVVYDYPGVTRDRLYTRAFWGDKEYVLIDTGGLMSDATRLPVEVQEAAFHSISADGLPRAIERQAAAGVAEADSVVLVVDGQDGLQPGDAEILDWLRTTHPNKPLLLAVNKCENVAKADIMVSEFWELGVEPRALSAISGTGTGDLLDELMKTLPPPQTTTPEAATTEEPLGVAIIGRPNVGKSSLLNAIAGEERSIVCDMSGTTRDAVDLDVTLPDGTKLKLIDTAGIRKRARVADSKDGAEQLSVDRALRAVRRADVAVLVVDGEEGITQQDFRLSQIIASEGKAVVVVVNKWDLVDHSVWNMEKMTENVQTQLREVGWANVVCTTAVKGRKIPEVLKAVLQAGEQHRRRVSTPTLNQVVQETVGWKAPPTQRGSSRKGRIYYTCQAAVSPPTFVFFVNDAKLFPDDYRRYMEKALRKNIGFPGTPLRLFWRGKTQNEAGNTRTRAEGKPSTKAKSTKPGARNGRGR